MTVKASRDTTYAIWTEGNDIFLGVWYTDEFNREKPNKEQLETALFIDSVSPQSLMHLALHFLNAGLSSMEMLFRRLQSPRRPEPGPDNGNGEGTAWGKQFKEVDIPEAEPKGDGDAPSEPE